MLTKKGKYAIRALIHLSKQPAGRPVLISQIAKEEGIPHKFLEAILLELKNVGLLDSRKGKGGGYHLQMPADSITLGRVVRAIDGPLAPIRCVSQTAYAPCAECPDEQSCAIRWVMKKVRDSTATILDSTTLEDLRRESQKASELAQSLSYSI